MIVVEGPDGAGKTTLIHEIMQQTNLPLAPRVVSKSAESMVDLVKWTEHNVAEGFQAKLFDRHRLISEPIYGGILRPRLEPGFDDYEWFETMMRSFYQLHPIVIYCIPPLSTVWENVRNDPDNEVVADPRIVQAIWSAYFNKAITEYTLRGSVYIYDYTRPFADTQRQLMINNIKRRVEIGNF